MGVLAVSHELVSRASVSIAQCFVRVSIVSLCFFCQAEDGIRDLVRSRGLGDVYKRQDDGHAQDTGRASLLVEEGLDFAGRRGGESDEPFVCLLYTSDAADERSSVDLGGRRIIQKKTKTRKC